MAEAAAAAAEAAANEAAANGAAANGAAANIGISDHQLLTLITAITAGQQAAAGGAAAPIQATALVQPMGACTLGREKLKRPKRWMDWLRDAENKMRYGNITEPARKWAYLRACAGPELTELWDKEVRVKYEATGEGDHRVEADTYDQAVKNTTNALFKLVNRDRAIMELLRMEQGNKTFNEFLADVEDQTTLCHNWERLTPEDMKRISLLGGLKDRTLAEKAIAEEYDLKRIIEAASNRENSRTNAEAMRNRPTGNVHRLETEERQYKGGHLDARENHLREELEEVRKLKQVGKYSGRHKGEGEKDNCPKCTYERHEGAMKCPAEDRTCNECGEKGHFRASKMCPKKKKKNTRRVKETETKDTSSESSSGDEEEQEVNKISLERVWPGTRASARQGGVRMIMTISSDEGSTDEDQEEGAQGDEDRAWPGTRDKAGKRDNKHHTHKNKPDGNIQAKNGNKDDKADQQQDNAKANTGKDGNARGEYKRPTEGQEEEDEDKGAGPDGKKKGSATRGGAGSNTEAQGAGLDDAKKGGTAEGDKERKPQEELAIYRIYRRLTCGWCQRTFHKSSGLKMHICYALTPARRINVPEAPHSDTAKTTTAKDNTNKDGEGKTINAKDVDGGSTYPLVDPRPEEAPDSTYSTVEQTTGADGSTEHPLDVTNKPLNSQHAKTTTAKRQRDDNGNTKTPPAKDNTIEDGNVETNEGNSYPLVDPRPEEAPDITHSTVVQSTGTDGSNIDPPSVMNNLLNSQHNKNITDKQRRDGNGKTLDAQDNTAAKTTAAKEYKAHDKAGGNGTTRKGTKNHDGKDTENHNRSPTDNGNNKANNGNGSSKAQTTHDDSHHNTKEKGEGGEQGARARGGGGGE